MDRCDFDDLCAAYVLGALEPDERRTFEEHLRGCGPCAGRVAEMAPAARSLVAAVPLGAAPPGLRGRVLAAITPPPASQRPAALQAAPPLRSFFTIPRLVAGLAAALLLAIALGGWNLRLQADVRNAQARTEFLYDAMALMGRADEWWYAQGTEAAPTASSSLAYSPADERACLLVWNFAKPAGKSVYAWVLRSGSAPEPVRLRGAGSILWAFVPGDVDGADSVDVTMEDREDPVAPAGPVLVRLPLAR